eukprot:scaffold7384_cov396-Prasinococcus_capsulatus_cf.AAC.8
MRPQVRLEHSCRSQRLPTGGRKAARVFCCRGGKGRQRAAPWASDAACKRGVVSKSCRLPRGCP